MLVGLCFLPRGTSAWAARWAERLTFAGHRSQPPGAGAQRAQAGDSPESWWQDDVEPSALEPLDPPAWASLFPGVRLLDATDARDRSCGVVTYEGVTSLCFSAVPGRQVEGLALGPLCDRLADVGVEVHSVSWSMRPPVLADAAELVGALQREAIGTGYAMQWPAEVTVRLTQRQVERAAYLRGGGDDGRAAALTHIAGTVSRTLRECGWSARGLDAQAIADDVGRALGLVRGQKSPQWAETWDGVQVGSRHHRCVALSQWGAGLRLVDAAGAAANVSVEFAVTAYEIEGARPVRLLARVSGSDPASVRTSARVLGSGRRGSSRWSTLNGSQLEGLRATTLVGEGHE